MHHAWNIDEQGRIVDTTWCGTEDAHFHPKPGSSYFGVVFDLDYVRRTTTSSNASVIDQWQKDYPVLREKYDNPAVAI